MRLRRLFVFFLLLPMMLMAENAIIRKVVAFWDSKVNLVLEDSLVHKTLEMPLNHLGLDIVYFDVQEPLPEVSKIENTRGIILCFPEQTAMKNPQEFIEWLISAIDKGKKILKKDQSSLIITF